MASILPMISNSFSLCSKTLGTILGILSTIGISANFVFRNFYSSLVRSNSTFSISFIFIPLFVGTAKYARLPIDFFVK